ncbi:MAG TPA: iron-sulfur cluster repair di-iron protein [Ilumatobacteraceae bacterium]|nr:iron-sulfur cluster repair di-iron protein [Ilumatobacteraceae bacterium]
MTTTQNDTITSSWTLNEVISAKPNLAARMEGLGLDYCCHGNDTLEQACAAAGLDVDQVTATLNQDATPGERAPWMTMSLSELVEHVVTVHHQYLWEELPRLGALMAKVHMVHGDRHPELGEIRKVFEAIRAELEPHLMKEERVLFPKIKELEAASDAPRFPFGTVDNPISVMTSEHEAAGELLDRLRQLTKSYQTPADGCASYQALFAGLERMAMDTHLHIHKENHRLFPAAIERERQLSA